MNRSGAEGRKHLEIREKGSHQGLMGLTDLNMDVRVQLHLDAREGLAISAWTSAAVAAAAAGRVQNTENFIHPNA